MGDLTFEKRSTVNCAAGEALAWLQRPGAFERLVAPWSGVRVASRTGLTEPGSRVELRVPVLGSLAMSWVAEHRAYEGGPGFKDVQTKGPFRSWEHVHGVEEQGTSACTIVDHIEYGLPFGPLGRALMANRVRKDLERTFAYRHRTQVADLKDHTRLGKRLRVAVTGASGLVGTALSAYLSTGGHDVVEISRSGPRLGGAHIKWPAPDEQFNAEELEGFDAVVHLAGESIAEGRWNAGKKKRILDSRVGGTEKLARALAATKKPPTVFVAASAIGFYGGRGDECLDEQSAAGHDFLAGVCRQWEAATTPAADAGVRVVNLRIGVVLTAAGGALAKVLLPFSLGAGGVVGNGLQFMSWVSLDDLLGIVLHAIGQDSLRGPVNAVSPSPVTNREYTRTLGSVMSRPTILPLPAFAARVALGEMADALLLSSTRVEPNRLKDTGYEFRHADVETALRHTLGR